MAQIVYISRYSILGNKNDITIRVYFSSGKNEESQTPELLNRGQTIFSSLSAKFPSPIAFKLIWIEMCPKRQSVKNFV